MVSTIIRVIASQDLREIAVKLVDIVSHVFFFFLSFVFYLSLLSRYALIIVFCFVSFSCFCLSVFLSNACMN